jgi:hypothetical protein
MKKLQLMLILLLIVSIALIGCGKEEALMDAENENAVQGSASEQNEDTKSTEETALSNIKMITLGTKSAMHYSELVNTVDKEGFTVWYEKGFINNDFYDQLWDKSPKGEAKLVSTSVKNVEIKAIDSNSFNFTVELTYNVKDLTSEEEVITTSSEKVSLDIVQDENGVYMIETFQLVE